MLMTVEWVYGGAHSKIYQDFRVAKETTTDWMMFNSSSGGVLKGSGCSAVWKRAPTSVSWLWYQTARARCWRAYFKGMFCPALLLYRTYGSRTTASPAMDLCSLLLTASNTSGIRLQTPTWTLSKVCGVLQNAPRRAQKKCRENFTLICANICSGVCIRSSRPLKNLKLSLKLFNWHTLQL